MQISPSEFTQAYLKAWQCKPSPKKTQAVPQAEPEEEYGSDFSSEDSDQEAAEVDAEEVLWEYFTACRVFDRSC